MTINYHDYVKYGGKYRQKVWNQIVNFSKRISEIFEVVNETLSHVLFEIFHKMGSAETADLRHIGDRDLFHIMQFHIF